MIPNGLVSTVPAMIGNPDFPSVSGTFLHKSHHPLTFLQRAVAAVAQPGMILLSNYFTSGGVVRRVDQYKYCRLSLYYIDALIALLGDLLSLPTDLRHRAWR